jgi:aminoacyl tRNA synthase complex-interacting multifunctional protein 1
METAETAETAVVDTSSAGTVSTQVDDTKVKFGFLDIRVGRIISAEVHPDADSLYVEQVDVGENVPRTIVSGLRKYVPLDEFVGRTVLVLCNLKARKMRGIMSHGMLLCACEIGDADQSRVSRVELLEPVTANDQVNPGERVTIEGCEDSTPDVVMNPKKRKWEACVPKMKSREGGGAPLACYDGKFLYSVENNAWFAPKTLKKYTIS